jgi:hypothetical protein
MFIAAIFSGSKEKYTLIADDTKFEQLSMDTYEMDDWLKYYAETESRITSWSKFLADNDLI